MPPPSAPPSGKPRRRTGPAMPGGWIWLVILLMLVGMFMLTSFNSASIEYGEFRDLVKDKNLSKVIFVGSERIVGEIRHKDRLTDDVKKKLGNSMKFATLRPPVEDPTLMPELL